ncbi:DUF5989 family protein [Caldithrix abyssi]|uniref:Uncharacterized protein n=1 Tax=Caldithrix abyssi DSM 13497 TaxID=880073 RepID=H1XRA3_CALAY|nr:DUF5989 family protein [Caldithrix abyssi]APF17108.1 hypothetical protein Cabys_357 [Caldithrix abyssi DSM 13497]EHO41254.1 hypothetical protein Calab_1634 [Caldithrix abyssi DSM 13497]
MGKIKIIAEYLQFLKAHKKWLLLPIVFILLLLGAVIVMAQGSPVALFIYSLF